MAKDRYRSFLDDEPENIQWRHGGPPTYDAVNKLFEEGRTKVQQPPYPLTLFPPLSLDCVFNMYLHVCRNGQRDHWRR